MTRYFGFAFSAAMLPPGDITLAKRDVSAEAVIALLEEGYVSCLNPSHKETIQAAHSRFGLNVQVPETAPRVILQPGDEMIVMQVTGLPRLTDQHEYTAEQIQSAQFVFVLVRLWTDQEAFLYSHSH